MLKVMSHKADQGGADVYAYLFARNNSFHRAEIPFVFRGTDDPLADRVSRVWVNFARTGVPSAGGLPEREPIPGRAEQPCCWTVHRSWYAARYALTELLVCGECGSPYKRCTWARNGKKRIVRRCVSRLEFGAKYCHNSPTLDEDRLRRIIFAGRHTSRGKTERFSLLCGGNVL